MNSTGVFIREVHVFSPKDLSEILVDNPLEIINRHVKTTITPYGVDMIIMGIFMCLAAKLML